MIELNSWKPDLTSQFLICPVPFHLDTYHGCTYGCKYCFARDFYEFTRRNSNNPSFLYLKGLKTDSLKNWINRIIKQEGDYDYTKGIEVALRERIPLKIGANSDPFPYVEKKEKITMEVLKIFNDYNYPLEIQTKNPLVLASYLDSFDLNGLNWNVAISISSNNQKIINAIEPHSLSIKDRYRGIKLLTSVGIKVMVKVQPVLYPIILNEIEHMVKEFKDAGCWAFNMEGLKIRKAMSKKEQRFYREMSNSLNFDLINFYNDENKLRNRINKSSDLELSHKKQMEYVNLGVALSKKYGIKFFASDNFIGKVGDGDECCGTEVLKDYKLNCYNIRSYYFGNMKNNSEHLGNCIINWTRSSRNNEENNTIKDIFTKKVKKLENIKKFKRFFEL